MTMVRVAPIAREALGDVVGDLARLRIQVFHDWPYLYEGDLAYEEAYLRPYLESENAIVVGAWDGDTLVGASTGAPMEDHADEFAAPFAAKGINLSTVFYCAESVLLTAYRGQGVGSRFFEEREARARALGRAFICFCAVIRPPNHPARPARYVPHDGFWRSRGYAPMDGRDRVLSVARYWRWCGDIQADAILGKVDLRPSMKPQGPALSTLRDERLPGNRTSPGTRCGYRKCPCTAATVAAICRGNRKAPP